MATLSRPQPPVASQEICNRCGYLPKACTCCELVCFERPQYHCGHLLTDADLSLQVKYLVEKNKLRNRALHGHGVVCGLKLSCDPHCDGHIILHDGYAIDDCGNDIVVCEKQRYDVIGALRAKRLIWQDRGYDPCEPEQEERECRIKECFYVSICYEEEDCEFETPFQAGCATGPQDCVPTRTRETYRLEVSDQLPEDQSYLNWLEQRLKHCFRLFRDSPVGRLMKNELHQIRRAVNSEACESREDQTCRCELFRMLKGHFIEQMKMCPDELDCRLVREVECLCCPERECDDYERQMSSCYCRLFELMLRYQYDCVLADLVFGCIEPEKACCVVLGTVEVIDGCLVRVCNTPRRYVWSFANLLPVAISAILTGSLTAARPGEPGEENGERRDRLQCCPDYGDFNCDSFLREFETDESARYKAATAILDAAKSAFGSLTEAFAFTQSDAFAPRMFMHLPEDVAIRHAESLGLEASSTHEPTAFDPVQAFLSQMLLRPQGTVEFYSDVDGRVRQVLRERRLETDHGDEADEEVAPEEAADEVDEGERGALPRRPARHKASRKRR